MCKPTQSKVIAKAFLGKVLNPTFQPFLKFSLYETSTQETDMNQRPFRGDLSWPLLRKFEMTNKLVV